MPRMPCLEDALDDYMTRCGGFDPRDPRRHALIRRLGFDGQPPITLQAAGDLVGITRERMRQIEAMVLDRTPPAGPWLQPLQAALDLLERVTPCAWADAAAALRKARLTRRACHPASVVSAALWFGLEAGVELDMIAERLRPSGFSKVARIVASCAQRQSSASGAGHLHELMRELKDRGVAATLELARECVAFDARFVMLGGDSFWYRQAPAGGNRLANVTRKILAAAARPVSLDLVRDGVARAFSIRRRSANQRRPRSLALLVPSIEVLRRFYEVHPDFTVDRAGAVSSAAPLDATVELGASERLIAGAIARTGGAVGTRALAEACGRMNRHTFNQTLYGSPIFVAEGPATWRIRGSTETVSDRAVRSA